MTMRQYYKQNPTELLVFVPYLLALILIWCVPANAQEPRTAIHPADPVSVTAHTAVQTQVATPTLDPGKPTIYPDPLPNIGLADIARALRNAHFYVPKATKVANDEKPIVIEELSNLKSTRRRNNATHLHFVQ